MHTKNHNHEVWFLSYRVRQTDLFVIWDYFLPLRGLPLTTWKIKVLEKWKCHHFTFVYQKPWSYDVCFLRYWVCERHNFLSFWAIFWPFTCLITQKIKSFEKMKKNYRRYHHFTYVHHKWQSYNVWFLRYEAQQT